MKNLKIILFSILVLGINVCAAQQAQTKPDRVKLFTKALSIDEPKAREIVSIIDDSDKRMLELFKNTKSDSKGMTKLIADLIAQKQLKINALLTNEQLDLFKQLLKEQTEKSKQRLKAYIQRNDDELSKPMKGAQLKKKELSIIQ